MRLEANGVIAFQDSTDHWQNGVCRLLGVSEESARDWVEGAARMAFQQRGQPLSAVRDSDAVSILRQAFEEIVPPPAERSLDLNRAVSVLGRVPDRVYTPSLDAELAVIGSDDLAWLVEQASLAPPPSPTVQYDETYFEGEESGVGYGGYLAQEAWRLEKSRRFLRKVEAVGGYLGLPWGERRRLLDIGSGYGFFRRAAEEAGWQHEGLEPSAHAGRVAEELFGFPSFVGDLSAYTPGPVFDAITMWDVLEHVPDPVSVAERALSFLAPGGALFLRTPNVGAIERDVFGPRYHSFKPEHLYCFGPDSLVEVLERAGFTLAFLTTDSHLLQGFFRHRLQGWARLLRGSDFFAVGVSGASSTVDP